MANDSTNLSNRSMAIPNRLAHRMNAIAVAWTTVFTLACLSNILRSPTPIHGIRDFLELAGPYLLVILAPLVGYRLASSSYPAGAFVDQPSFRLSFYGRWRSVSPLDAERSPLFGPAGFMASLLIGLLLNVVIRSFEFLVAVPALNSHAPHWGTELFHLMAADVVIMSFFYMVCFVMALRSIPYFPRMLLLVWMLDIFLQLFIARSLQDMPDLPLSVAMPLQNLLHGNIQKVLISIFVWLPYLILSDRVNITYRRRVRLA